MARLEQLINDGLIKVEVDGAARKSGPFRTTPRGMSEAEQLGSSNRPTQKEVEVVLRHMRELQLPEALIGPFAKLIVARDEPPAQTMD